MTDCSVRRWTLIFGIACWLGLGMSGVVRAAAPEEVEESARDGEPQPTGVEIGQFLVKEFHPVRGAKSTLSFSLFAIVTPAELDGFRETLEQCQQKIRDQIITAARLVDIADFDDPELLVLRHRIVLRLRRAVPELKFDDVLVTDFQFVLEN